MSRDHWTRLPFSKAVEINPKRAVKKGEKVPFVEMAALSTSGSKIQYLEQRVIASGGSRFQNGDTLFARITPCAENGKIGFVDCLPPGRAGAGSTEFIVFGPRNGVTEPKFVYHLARSKIVREPALGSMMGTTGRQRVPNSVFDEIEVPLPPLSEQRRIAEILSSVDEAIHATQAVIEQTRKVKQGALNRLLTKGMGHTRFKQTEIGEIPDGWSLTPLAAISAGKPKSGKSPSTSGSPTDIVSFSIAAVRDGEVTFKGNLKYVDISPSDAQPYMVRRGDILVVRGNANPDIVGSCGVVEEHPANCIYPDLLIRISPEAQVCHPDFLALVWNSDFCRNQIKSKAKSTNGTYKINQQDISSILLPLPPLEEQKLIIQQINALQVSSRLSKRQLAHLIQTKTALMSDLLTGRKRVLADLPMAAE
ncbi:restriction endonuclease subunit S [Microvirga sp. 17 mud 1-3]|uniref:restriction endonuclease subunit S n=1 Tax=Microvirga sp. 17 mud 1-3 TaxID=2082949 RepID=UPI000D6AABE7|nr:restriction endonuclease subunit S [Microvirga sp. 17 mud 1-3]AWM86796.1 hypothetical protein C4E04_08715 [Microvirga sp. 17 mud 1-3]